MADIHNLFGHADDIERAECSAESAANLLRIAAGYLDRREVMPIPLADFISSAFSVTASVEPEQRPAKLAELLNLTSLNRRPSYSKFEIDEFMLWYVFRASSRGQSDTQIVAEIANAQKVSKTKAWTYLREWRKRNPKIVASFSVVRNFNLTGKMTLIKK